MHSFNLEQKTIKLCPAIYICEKDRSLQARFIIILSRESSDSSKGFTRHGSRGWVEPLVCTRKSHQKKE